MRASWALGLDRPLRLLFLTNLYPPAAVGGYEQWCQEVAEGLRQRDHEVVVLTSRHDRAGPGKRDPRWVHRDLHLEMEFAPLRNATRFFVGGSARERENLSTLRGIIDSFHPEAVLVWGMWNLCRSLPALAESLVPERVIYYFGDYWPALPSQYEFYWRTPGRHWAARLPKRLLGVVARRTLERQEQPRLAIAHALFPSRFVRDEFARLGVPVQRTEIVYGGIDTHIFVPQAESTRQQRDGILSLLYSGRLAQDKGVHTAIEAVATLVHQRETTGVRLNIVGSGSREYESHLRELARRGGIEHLVAFLGPQPKQAMPALYHAADVLLFTSTWPEPFGRVLVEAMASGTAVVATAVGGAAEILIENENALLFTPNDASGLAGQIQRLAESPQLRQRLAAAGQRMALEKFDISDMISGIESYVRRIGA